MGFLGPVGIKIPLVIDRAIAAMPTVVVGGNAVDVHFKGVVPGPRLPARADPRHPQRRGRRPLPALRRRAGGQVGPGDRPRLQARDQVFQGDGGDLPRREGERDPRSSWDATGSASTGSSPRRSRRRTTRNGIIWPLSIAPYHVLIVPLQLQNAAVMEQAAALESALAAAGLDVLVDDRDQRPGFKFKDADLIGIPLRVVVGERGLKDGKIEIKWRHEPEAKQVPAETAAAAILDEVAAVRRRHDDWCARAPDGPGRREAVMSRMPPLPRLPYALLGLLTARLLRRAVRRSADRPRRDERRLAARPPHRVGRHRRWSSPRPPRCSSRASRSAGGIPGRGAVAAGRGSSVEFRALGEKAGSCCVNSRCRTWR